MGLFSITKKPEEKKSLGVQKVSQFPQFPPMGDNETPEFPAYEPTIGDIKKEITKTETPMFDIPTREKKSEPRMFAASSSASSFSQQPNKVDFNFGNTGNVKEDHMLFVKIDKYKQAMHDIQHLKNKIAEAEKILSNLEELKAEEDAKLSKWSSGIQELKDNLMSLDKNLFE